MAKKENILDVLKGGTSKTEKSNEFFPYAKNYARDIFTKVTNGNFCANFVAGDEENILARQKRFEREIANKLNYGHSAGKAGVYKPNKTEIVLSKLSAHRAACVKYYAMYQKALKAPKHLREYVFQNIGEWLHEHKDFSLNFETGFPVTFDIVEVFPKAWTKGWENEDLFGWQTDYQLDDLLPAAGLEIGRKVFVPFSRTEKIEGEIIGYSYFRKHRRNYGANYGEYVIWYDVKYGDSRYAHAEFKFNEISFAA